MKYYLTLRNAPLCWEILPCIEKRSSVLRNTTLHWEILPCVEKYYPAFRNATLRWETLLCVEKYYPTLRSAYVFNALKVFITLIHNFFIKSSTVFMIIIHFPLALGWIWYLKFDASKISSSLSLGKQLNKTETYQPPWKQKLIIYKNNMQWMNSNSKHVQATRPH